MTRRWPIVAVLLSVFLVPVAGPRAKEPAPRLLLWGSSTPPKTKWILVGAVRAGRWSPAAQAGRLLGASDPYQVYTALSTANMPVARTAHVLAREPGAFVGGRGTPDLDGAVVVPVNGPRLRPGDFMAVSGEPTAMPRREALLGVLRAEWQAVLVEHLKKKHVSAEGLRSIAVRVDIDGDGKEEVLLQGTASKKVGGGKGGSTFETFSFLLELRTGERPRIVTEDHHGESSDRFEDELLAVLDLDGDGTFELV